MEEENRLRIVFMGTPQFAVPVLERLAQDGHEVAAVYTQPDKPVGRGYQLTPPPVKVLAEKLGLPVYQPQKLRDGAVAAQIAQMQVELAVVVAYGRILPPDILSAPKFGCINLHASLLPKYRGASPIQWSIVNGEAVTGVTSMFMAQEMDTGDIILQHETPIGEDETAPELSQRLSEMSAVCAAETVRLFERGEVLRRPQDEDRATYAPILKKEMGQIDFQRTAREVHNLVRGLYGWPCAYTFLEGKRLRVHRTSLVPDLSGNPGEVLDNKRLIVGCGEGAIELLEVQLDGKQRVKGEDFMRGARIKAHAIFTNR